MYRINQWLQTGGEHRSYKFRYEYLIEERIKARTSDGQCIDLYENRLTTNIAAVLWSFVMECDICNKTFTTKGNLARHKRTHTGDKRFECDICQKKFFRSSHVAEHKRTHTNERPYECDVCQKKFTRSCHLFDHKKIHNEEKPHQCDICSTRFSLLTHLADHKSKHTEDKRYECDICHQIFTQSGAITRHKRTHSGVKPYKCHICEQTFARSSSLTRHHLTHTKEKRFQCHVCKQCFSRSSHLARHTKRKHSEKTPKECGDYQLLEKSVTQGISSGDYYQCDLCNEQLTDFKHFIQHKTRDHGIAVKGDTFCTDELTDVMCVCSLCGISFDIPQQLEQHMNTHGMG